MNDNSLIKRNPPLSIVVIVFILVAIISFIVLNKGKQSGEENNLQTESEQENNLKTETDIKNLIRDFVQENLNDAYQPDSLNVAQLSSSSQTDKTVYGSAWDVKFGDSRATISAIYWRDASKKEIFISVILSTITENLDAEKANLLYSRFFKSLNPNWLCVKNKDETSTNCEVSTGDGMGKVESPIGNSVTTSIEYNVKL